MSEMLRSVRLGEVAVGDIIVKASGAYGLPLAYGIDKDGYTTLRADIGTRFEIIAHGPDWVSARDADGNEMTQHGVLPTSAALKVVERPAKYRRGAA